MNRAKRRKAAGTLARLICRHRLSLLPIAMVGTLAVWSIALHGLAADHARSATADKPVHRPAMTASQPLAAFGATGG